MKKFVLFLILLIIVLNGCQVSELEEETKKELPPIEERLPPGKESLPLGERFNLNNGLLSDIQISACDTAHEAGTCDTRLEEVGIVLKEDCCEVLGKCC